MKKSANEVRLSFLTYFERHGHRVMPSSPLVPHDDPDAAFHERWDEPVQGRVSRPRAAQLPSCDHRAEMHARQREAQRSRERRAVAQAPHVLRDAGEFLVRRLLQEGRHPVRLGAAHERMEAAGGSTLRHCVQGGVRCPQGRGRLRRLEDIPPRRTHRRARRRRQLLADGRHRPVRPVLGDLLLPGSRHSLRRGGGWPQVPRARVQLRPLHRDLEQRLHGVRPAGGRHAAASAGAVHRHRHGARADYRGPPGRPVELRHRPLHPAAVGDRRAGTRPLRGLDVAGGRLDARGGRPHAGDDVPHRRRGCAVERVAGIRAAEDHAARHAARETPGRHRALPASPGRRRLSAISARPIRSSARAARRSSRSSAPKKSGSMRCLPADCRVSRNCSTKRRHEADWCPAMRRSGCTTRSASRATSSKT